MHTKSKNVCMINNVITHYILWGIAFIYFSKIWVKIASKYDWKLFGSLHQQCQTIIIDKTCSKNVLVKYTFDKK